MITIINEAINRKLKDTSFTNIVNGLVTSVNPLVVRIEDRLDIPKDFIEPKSLGFDEFVDGQVLPLSVNEKINLVSYNNGQYYYVLNKGSSDYNSLNNKPVLNTTRTTSFVPYSNEIIAGTLFLHRIAKSGDYSDLLGKPDLSVYMTLSTTQTVTGSKNFTTLPTSSLSPTATNHLVNKYYVDNSISSVNSSITSINSSITSINGSISTLNTNYTTLSNNYTTLNTQINGSGSTSVMSRLSALENSFQVLWTGSATVGAAITFNYGGNTYDARSFKWFVIMISNESVIIPNVYPLTNNRTLFGIGGVPGATTNKDIFTNAIEISLYNTFSGLTYVSGKYIRHIASSSHDGGGLQPITAIVGVK